ncbi:MAG TPA: ATP-dependent Clp protease proteolytic subunit [Candidatus Binataceae bacterium]|nr:ATP-dependent Clp protease proteolytic subunit [Candidatus Binataceae bacterium]
MAVRVLSANDLVEQTLQGHLLEIEKKLNGDGIAFVGPITLGIDDALRDAVEAIDNKKDKLIFILETDGGYAETARRIADMLRHHYKTVDFVVPGYALSAGTILVMSGDAIYMDYFSILGPIDPQVESSAGKPIPASGYLIRYEELLNKANNGQATTAEMELLLSFDQGELYSYDQARDLSIALLEEWLVKYKFKDWNRQCPFRCWN